MKKLLNPADLAEEHRLVEAARRDPRRFDEIYERYFNRVYAFAVVRTANREEAEDVTSETFRRVVSALPAFEWRGVPLSAWIFRIAANVSADLLRRRGRQVELLEDHGELAPFEASAVLFDLVDRLPPAQRDVLIQRFVVDQSLRETAACLGKTEGAIKQLQRRALQQLRSWLEAGDA